MRVHGGIGCVGKLKNFESSLQIDWYDPSLRALSSHRVAGDLQEFSKGLYAYVRKDDIGVTM